MSVVREAVGLALLPAKLVGMTVKHCLGLDRGVEIIGASQKGPAIIGLAKDTRTSFEATPSSMSRPIGEWINDPSYDPARYTGAR